MAKFLFLDEKIATSTGTSTLLNCISSRDQFFPWGQTVSLVSKPISLQRTMETRTTWRDIRT